MQTVQIKDKTFELMMTEEEILSDVVKVAERINEDLVGELPLFMGVLNGSFMFMADLMKRITIPCEISFVKLASYVGTSTTGKVQELIGLSQDLKGRTVVVVEDIVETGLTMQKIIEMLREKEVKDVHVCTMFFKPALLRVPLKVEYVAKEISNDFILGYGLDYDQQGRNLRNLYKLKTKN